MTTSQQPRITALPAKHRPEVMPTSGTSPLSWPNMLNAGVCRLPAKTWSVSPGRPPPPSVKKTMGSRARSASLNIRSFFWWFFLPWVPASTV